MTETPRTPRTSAVVIPLIVWLLIQLAAVALAASGVPLSANFPRPPQSLAVHEMLIAQFIGSAMFFPALFRGGWRGWLAMVLSAAPMLVLAAWLARMPMSRVPILWVHVTAWVTMLAVWGAVGVRRTETPKAQGWPSLGVSPALTALATLLSGGGLLVWYLHFEFQPDRDIAILRLFPLPTLLRSLTAPGSPTLSPLLSTIPLSAAALVILAVKTSRHRANGRSSEL